ncbi:serine-rich adhesin for platelets-like isoform X2 [Littorina saxatilis]|uniref:serine-rich adhesin for platelets-like isoform X2 n=1 Tax=Littorina saxatilis TaxID=31220 RepID=UPI0038B4AEA2
MKKPAKSAPPDVDTTAKNKRTTLSLRTNKVRRSFHRGKPGRTTGSQPDVSDAVAGPSVSGDRTKPKRGVPPKTLKRLGTNPGRRGRISAATKSTESERPEPAAKAGTVKSEKVSRALKKLAIDFKESKVRAGKAATSSADVTTLQGPKRGKKSGVSDLEAASAPGGKADTSKQAGNELPGASPTSLAKKKQRRGFRVGRAALSPRGKMQLKAGSSAEAQVSEVVRKMKRKGVRRFWTKRRNTQAGISPIKRTALLSKVNRHREQESSAEGTSGTMQPRNDSVDAVRSRSKNKTKLDSSEPMETEADKTVSTDTPDEMVDSQASGSDEEMDSEVDTVTLKTVSRGRGGRGASRARGSRGKTVAEVAFRGRGRGRILCSRGRGSSRGPSRGLSRGRGSSRGSGRGRGFSRGSGRGRGFSRGSGRGRGFSRGRGPSRGRGSSRGRGRTSNSPSAGAIAESDAHDSQSFLSQEELETNQDVASGSRRDRPRKNSPARSDKGSVDVELKAKPVNKGEENTKVGAKKRTKNNREQSAESTDFPQQETFVDSAAGVLAFDEIKKIAKLRESRDNLMSRLSPLTKERSSSMECLLHDRSSAAEQTKAGNYSRSSSPGGTDFRALSKNLSVLKVDLLRSPSVDSMLQKSASESLLKPVHSSAGDSISTVGAQESRSDSSLHSMSPSFASLSSSGSFVAKDFYGEQKQKRRGSPLVPSVAVKKKRLLSRLKDSSTKQVPDILTDMRPSRGGSAGGSRESSPGTVLRVKERKSKEKLGKLETGIDAESSNVEEKTTLSQNKVSSKDKLIKLSASDAIPASLILVEQTEASVKNVPISDTETSVTDSFLSEPTQNMEEAMAGTSTAGRDGTTSKKPRGRPHVRPQLTKVHRKPGRPKGSRNKTTIARIELSSVFLKQQDHSDEGNTRPTDSSTSAFQQPVKPKRGRPSVKDLLQRKRMKFAAQTTKLQLAARGVKGQRPRGRQKATALSQMVPSVSSLEEDQQLAGSDADCKDTDFTVHRTELPQSKDGPDCGTEEKSRNNALPYGAERSDSPTSHLQPSSSNRIFKKMSAISKSGGNESAVAYRRRACPAVGQSRKMIRRKKRSRWASGRLPKQSAAALGKVARSTTQPSISSYFTPQESKTEEKEDAIPDANETEEKSPGSPSCSIESPVAADSPVVGTELHDNEHGLAKEETPDPEPSQVVTEMESSDLQNQQVLPDVEHDNPDESSIISEAHNPDESSVISEAPVTDQSANEIIPETSDAAEPQTLSDKDAHNCEQTHDIPDSAEALCSETKLPPQVGPGKTAPEEQSQVSSETKSEEVSQQAPLEAMHEEESGLVLSSETKLEGQSEILLNAPKCEDQSSQDVASITNSEGLSGEQKPGETDPKQEVVPQKETEKPKRKRVSYELKRLQRDEGVQKIMSWREKKKLKSVGLLLRSRIKKQEEPEQTQTSDELKNKHKQYSIDALSDTKLIIKTGKTFAGTSWKEVTEGTDQEAKRGILSVSSSLDSEDGPPPIISEVAPFRDNRPERDRSEELSPPPLMGPEDPYSEDYFLSMPVSSSSGRSRASEEVTSEVGAPHYTQTAISDTAAGIDVPQGLEASGVHATTAPKKKRGRPAKQKQATMGPASKTGRAPHVRPGPASSKPGRKPKAEIKIDPTYIQHVSTLKSQPHTFALRPKTTRSPIEIIAMRQKQEEEEYELAEATRRARLLKRRQAHFDKLVAPCDPESQQVLASCKPCSVILVDFVKELHLNSIDTSDQYVSDVSCDSDERDEDDDDNDYSADYDPLHDEADIAEEEQEEFQAKTKSLGKDTVQRKIVGTARTVSRKSLGKRTPREKLKINLAQEVGQRMLNESGQSVESTSAKTPPAVKKTSPDLESLRGKGFMGNFVDFIENRGIPKSPLLHIRGFKAKMSQSGAAASTLLGSSLSEATPPSMSSSSVSDSSVAQASSIDLLESSTKRGVTAVDVHVAATHQPQSVVDKTVSKSPAKLQESVSNSTLLAEKETVSSSPTKTSQNTEGKIVKPQSPGLAVPKIRSPERGQSPGKLKVIPNRKELDSGSGDKVANIRYRCTKCEFSATTKGIIESHVYRHIPGVTFKCGYCDSEFTGLVSALTHVKNSHHNKEPKVWISKDINEASFYTEEAISTTPEAPDAQKHQTAVTSQISESTAVQEKQPVIISLVMSGDMPVQRQTTQRRFACTHCSYCTNVVEDANQHVRDLHQGNSLYTCYLCDKALGCSLQEVEAHCRETHPHRQNAYKKLPDFYDQELMRANSVDRPRSVEDRGNIFDRMSSLFPNMGPGGELVDDGQLSPQARHLRARDYLYIREGWNVKTSAEADSTTVEDIELPIDETAEAEGPGLDSTCEESSDKRDESFTEPLDSQAVGALHDTATSASVADNVVPDVSDSVSQPIIRASTEMSDGHSAVLSVKAAESVSLENPSDGGDASVLETVTAKEGLDTPENTDLLGDKTGVNIATPEESTQPCTESSEEGGKTTTADADVDPAVSDTTVDISAPTATPDSLMTSEEKQPSSSDADDDAENDILVINLEDDDGLEDMADDCSTPDEDKAEPSLTDLSAEQANTSTVSHDEEVNEDDGIGIKILSVVSLRDTMDEVSKVTHSPAASPPMLQAESSPTSVPTATSAAEKSQPASSIQPSSSTSTGKKSSTSSKSLPEVNADDIAIRNEKMVCTYKCFKCSVHSPQLSAIVEHLKQHHHDVPLFTCPYCCKTKKLSFFTEEKVHMHVRDKHPSNYAKNEVSLSETAKSFIQVLALPSGRNARDGQIEHDIFMCLECESHIPNLDYGHKHLKGEHPDLLKYACPTCGMFSDTSEEEVKNHMTNIHGQVAESVPLSVAVEGVFLSKVIAISDTKEYKDHCASFSAQTSMQKVLSTKAVTPPKSAKPALTASSTVSTSDAAVPNPASFHTVPVAIDNTTLVSSGPMNPIMVPVHMNQVGSLLLAPMQQQQQVSLSPQLPSNSRKTKPGKQKGGSLFAASSAGIPGSATLSHRPILPMPTLLPESPRKRALETPHFQKTGVTVKNMLDSRQRENMSAPPQSMPVDESVNASASSDSSPSSALSINTSTQGSVPDSVSPRRMFSMTDRLDRLGRSRRSVSPHSSPPSTTTSTASSISPASRPVLRVPQVSPVLNLAAATRDTASSMDTGTTVNTLQAARSPARPLPVSSLPVSALPFSIAALTAPVTTVASLSSQASPSAQRLDREDPEAFKIFNLKPRTPQPAPLRAPAVSISPVTAHVSLPIVGPSIMTPAVSQVPMGVTMASSALFPQQFQVQQFPQMQQPNISTLPIGQGGLPIGQPLQMPFSSPQPGIAVPINASQAQLLMAQSALAPLVFLSQLRGTMPQFSAPSGTVSAPAAHQQPPSSTPAGAAINLSLMQPGLTSPVLGSPRLNPPVSSPAPYQPRGLQNRGRGRPRLNRNPLVQQINPRIPTQPPVLRQLGPPPSSPTFQPPRPSSPGARAPQHRQGVTQQYMCPYCSQNLRPWEVAQHIQVNHPGQDVRYKRV